MVSKLFAKVFEYIYFYPIIYLIFFSDPVIPSSIIKSLPGFPGSLPFKLETGYIAIDEKQDVQSFYYFFESEGNPREDPLMLWFTGGPGCSGLSAIVFEIGPIRFNTIEYKGSLPTWALNRNSWTKVASIIFIDAPVGTGFSYSRSWEGSLTGDLVFADQGFIFLKKWLLTHPKFISNSLYIGGTSFAGFIVPIVAEEIAKSIEDGDTPEINFQGYLVGSPITYLNYEKNFVVPFAHRMGLISDELYESVKRTCKGQYRGNHNSSSPCAKGLYAISLCIENINDEHILEPICKSIFSASGMMEKSKRKSLLEKPSGPEWVQPNLHLEGSSPEFPEFGCRRYNNLLIYIWANDKSVRRAIHIQEEAMKTWVRCNKNLPYKTQLESVVSYHQRLNSGGYRALVFSGDHDMVTTYIGTQAWIKSLNIPVVGQWRPWLVDDQIAGYVTEYSNGLTFATVKGGGHTAPAYRPKECFTMFKRWISQERL